MKTELQIALVCSTVLLHAHAFGAEPILESWFTKHSGKYAQLYATLDDMNAGRSRTTWSRGSINQSVPAYSGVQEISASDDWVYIRTTGLGSHIMGPWYLDAARSRLFPNLPANKKALYRIPRTPVVPVNKTLTGLGTIGYFVDGVAMFDGRDSFYWNGSTETGGPGGGIWNRDAYVNEGVTFDPANAHQERTGTYHYHANPVALRYLLGDHVKFDPATYTYSESPLDLHHSPIIGWVRDGFPIYGPYGYSNPKDPNSGVRRMTSGFVLRDGKDGTANLAATGRITIPSWAARAQNRATALSTAQYGPSVSAQYPLGRYLEDNDYLGDLGKTHGVDFDLDEYNGRFCVTPEFPNGTYAYFVTVSASGVPVFPYNIGRSFYGSPSGGSVQTIAEPTRTYFAGGPDSPIEVALPARENGTVTLVWSSVDGGAYRVESSDDLQNWNTLIANVASQGTLTQTSETSASDSKPAGFYRVTRTGISNYDTAAGTN